MPMISRPLLFFSLLPQDEEKDFGIVHAQSSNENNNTDSGIISAYDYVRSIVVFKPFLGRIRITMPVESTSLKVQAKPIWVWGDADTGGSWRDAGC